MNYAEELKRLSENSIDTKELKKVLLDSLSQGFYELTEKERNASFFLMLQVSIADNISLKAAYERYAINRIEIMPLAERFDQLNMKLLASVGYRLKVVKRDNKIEFPDNMWYNYVADLYTLLIKKLEIEIG